MSLSLSFIINYAFIHNSLITALCFQKHLASFRLANITLVSHRFHTLWYRSHVRPSGYLICYPEMSLRLCEIKESWVTRYFFKLDLISSMMFLLDIWIGLSWCSELLLSTVGHVGCLWNTGRTCYHHRLQKYQVRYTELHCCSQIYRTVIKYNFSYKKKISWCSTKLSSNVVVPYQSLLRWEDRCYTLYW